MEVKRWPKRKRWVVRLTAPKPGSSEPVWTRRQHACSTNTACANKKPTPKPSGTGSNGYMRTKQTKKREAANIPKCTPLLPHARFRRTARINIIHCALRFFKLDV